MAYLHQASVSEANSSKLTISAWVQFSTSDDFIPILQFGGSSGNVSQFMTGPNTADPTKFGSFRSCGIWKQTTSGASQIVVMLSSVFNSFDSTHILAGFSGDTSNPSYASLTDTIGAHSNWTASTAFVAGQDTIPTPNLVSAIAAGKWFHIFLSVDFSSRDGIITRMGTDFNVRYADPNNIKRVWFWINGTDYGLGNVEVEFDPGSTENPPIVPTNGVCSSALVAPDGVSISNFIEDANAGLGYGYCQYEVPPWTIDYNGTELAVPCVGANAATGKNPVIRLSDVQVYLGQFINPNTYFNKFVTKSAGTSTPTDPAVAQAAFGAQTFLFTGNASVFATNDGSGGSVSSTGTISDFATTPSYTD